VRALLQRVSTPARVWVDSQTVGEIEAGLVVFLGVASNDTPKDLTYLANKIPSLRIFEDAAGKMNLSLEEAKGEILLVSQFTLVGELSGSGRRPSFSTCARPEIAKPFYEQLIQLWQGKGITVATGKFGADMKVELTNDGPVTFWLDSAAR
jgi:D-tyrosyl-tRNA(Tyr) deacylase